MALTSWPSGRVKSSEPESGVVPNPSDWMPNFASAPSKVGIMPKTPIDPVMVPGSAQISSDVDDTQ